MSSEGCLDLATILQHYSAGKQWGTSQYVREGLPAALEGADALAAAKAAKAYANAVEDAQEAASRAARPAARRAGSGRLAGGTRSLAARRATLDP